jgi:hypothetical protein
MKTKRIAICTIALLLAIAIITSGCSNSQESAKRSKLDLDAKITKMLPSTARISGSSTFDAPLTFQASVDGVVYYIGGGNIFLNTPLLKGDIIKLNYWSSSSQIPNTKITINDEMVYHNPTTRHGDNRFYFIPTTPPLDIKPE